jgi:crotonobetainyl-CoA:carnitine CoA-transferase CaiB-like acyl-CoA transferase
MGAIFLGVNRGKRSVVLDLKQAADRAALGKLVDTADVLMHSIRPQSWRPSG